MQSLLNAWSNVKNMKDEIRIRLSVGLIVVAVLHAVMLGAVFTALHRNPEPQQDTSWQVPPATPVPQVSRSIEKLSIGNEPPWRYSDPFRIKLRIHTKLVDTIE